MAFVPPTTLSSPPPHSRSTSPRTRRPPAAAPTGLRNESVASATTRSCIRCCAHACWTRVCSTQAMLLQRAWANRFESSPGAQRQAFGVVLEVSREIDAKYGTRIVDAFRDNYLEGLYKRF